MGCSFFGVDQRLAAGRAVDEGIQIPLVIHHPHFEHEAGIGIGGAARIGVQPGLGIGFGDMHPALLEVAAFGAEDRLDGEGLGAHQRPAGEEKAGVLAVELHRLADRRIHQLRIALDLRRHAADMRQVVEFPDGLVLRRSAAGGKGDDAQKRGDFDAAPAHKISPSIVVLAATLTPLARRCNLFDDKTA